MADLTGDLSEEEGEEPKLPATSENLDFKNAPKRAKIDLDKVEEDINGALKVYDRMAIQFRFALAIFGISSLGLSLFVSTFVGVVDENQIRIISYISTLCLSLITYFGIAGQGNRSRNAWRHLRNAQELYLAGVINVAYLIKAYGEAEAILGETNFSYQLPDKK